MTEWGNRRRFPSFEIGLEVPVEEPASGRGKRDQNDE
jgi:hypothetical protein